MLRERRSARVQTGAALEIKYVGVVSVGREKVGGGAARKKAPFSALSFLDSRPMNALFRMDP